MNNELHHSTHNARARARKAHYAHARTRHNEFSRRSRNTLKFTTQCTKHCTLSSKIHYTFAHTHKSAFSHKQNSMHSTQAGHFAQRHCMTMHFDAYNAPRPHTHNTPQTHAHETFCTHTRHTSCTCFSDTICDLSHKTPCTHTIKTANTHRRERLHLVKIQAHSSFGYQAQDTARTALHTEGNTTQLCSISCTRHECVRTAHLKSQPLQLRPPCK